MACAGERDSIREVDGMQHAGMNYKDKEKGKDNEKRREMNTYIQKRIYVARKCARWGYRKKARGTKIWSMKYQLWKMKDGRGKSKNEGWASYYE